MLEWLFVSSSQLAIFGSVKMMFTKLLLNKELNDTGNCWKKCFQNYDIVE